MKLLGLEWYKWLNNLLILTLGSGLGFLYQEIKETSSSASSYTDTTFTRFQESQYKLLEAQQKTIEEIVSANKKSVAKLIQDNNRVRDESSENLRLTVASLEDLGTNERAEIRKEMRALSLFARNTRDELIEVITRVEERK